MAATNPFNTHRKRRQADPSNPPSPTDLTANLQVVANRLRVTVTATISIAAIPHYGASGGAHTGTEYPTGYAFVSPGVVDLAYAHNVAVGNTITIPTKDPGIRAYSGAYVAPQTTVLA